MSATNNDLFADSNDPDSLRDAIAVQATLYRRMLVEVAGADDESRAGSDVMRAERPGSALILPLSLGELSREFPPQEADGSYRYSDLAIFDDRAFVRAAFQAVLRVLPEPGAEGHYLGLLRAGRHKAELLLRLRYGHAGRGQRTRVRGLLWRVPLAVCARVPVLRGLLGLLEDLLSAGVRARRLQARQAELCEYVRLTARLVESKTNECVVRLNALSPPEPGIRAGGEAPRQ